MPFRTAADATRALTASLQRAISCVTSDVLVISSRPGGATVTRALVLPRAPVALRGIAPLSLDVSHVFRVESPSASGEWDAITVGYRYQLYLRDGNELLAYHWHPDEPSPIKVPHAHLGAGAGLAFRALAGAHLPTGIVDLQDVLHLALTDLGVRPLRSDWATILAGG